MSKATTDKPENPSHPYAGLENADTNYATWFEPDEIDRDEEFEGKTDWRKTHKHTYWKILHSQHRGHRNGAKRVNKPFQTFLSNRHLSESFSTALSLTKSEKMAAEKWFRRLKFDRLGYDIRLSAFSICLFLVKRDERDERQSHPNAQSNWPDEFQKYYDSLPQEQQRRLHKAYGKIARRIRSWQVGEDEPASEQMDKYEVWGVQFNS